MKVKKSQFKKLTTKQKNRYIVNTLQKTPLDNKNQRSRLRAISNCGRQTYTGTYVRCGYKTDGGYFYELNFYPTLLIKDVECNGIPVTNHLWLDYTKGFRKLGQLKPGDKVSFSAKVGWYEKGYYLHQTTDYQLNSLRNVKLASNYHKSIPLPMDSDLVVGYTMVKNVNFYLTCGRPYSSDLVGIFDKWSQTHTPNHLDEIKSAEERADDYDPMPYYYSDEDDSNVTELNETTANDAKHSKLVKLGNKKRYTFIGTYQRAGYTNFKNHYTPNLTIISIYYHNTRVCGKLTFNYSKSFKKLGELHTGDKIQFNARVKVNVTDKGLMNEKHYYKLAYPTHAKLIKKTDNQKRIPFPTDKSKQDIIVGFAMQDQNDYESYFRVDLWKLWKLKQQMRNQSSRYNPLKELLIDLTKQRMFGRHCKDNTTNFYNDIDDDEVPNLPQYLSINPKLANRLGITLVGKHVYDLTTDSIMNWEQLDNRCKALLNNHHLQFKATNPLKHHYHHLTFLHHKTFDSLLNQIIKPTIKTNASIYFYLVNIKDNHNSKTKKLAKRFHNEYKAIIKEPSYSVFSNGTDNDSKIKKIRLSYMYYLRLKRDTLSSYSQVKLSKQSLKNIKKVIRPKYLKLDLTTYQRLNDFRKAMKYVDFPIVRKR